MRRAELALQPRPVDDHGSGTAPATATGRRSSPGARGPRPCPARPGRSRRGGGVPWRNAHPAGAAESRAVRTGESWLAGARRVLVAPLGDAHRERTGLRPLRPSTPADGVRPGPPACAPPSRRRPRCRGSAPVTSAPRPTHDPSRGGGRPEASGASSRRAVLRREEVGPAGSRPAAAPRPATPSPPCRVQRAVRDQRSIGQTGGRPLRWPRPTATCAGQESSAVGSRRCAACSSMPAT